MKTVKNFLNLKLKGNRRTKTVCFQNSYLVGCLNRIEYCFGNLLCEENSIQVIVRCCETQYQVELISERESQNIKYKKFAEDYRMRG